MNNWNLPGRIIYQCFVSALLLILPVGNVLCQTDDTTGQTFEVTGESFKILDNKKDIYHSKNSKARQEMIEAAVFDAIDKGASRGMTSVIEHIQYSNSISHSFEDVFEDYLSSSLTKINIEWIRTSSYKFARDESDKNEKGRKWKCQVSGKVINLGTGNLRPSEEKPRGNNDYYITRKSFNIVHINAGAKDNISVGDKFLAYKYKGKKALTGINMKPKIMGLITIKSVSDSYSEGRVLKGTFSVREAHQAKKYNYKKFRSGLEYQLSGSYEQFNTSKIGDTEADIKSKTHALYYYYFSYISRVGFKLGAEVFDIDKNLNENSDNDTSAYAFSPKFNLNYSIGIIPDFLFIVPNASVGYLFFENEKDGIFNKADKSWDANVFFESDISVHVRLMNFDLIGGITYKYINDLPDLTNYYPHIGLAYNFVRYARKGLTGE